MLAGWQPLVGGCLSLIGFTGDAAALLSSLPLRSFFFSLSRAFRAAATSSLDDPPQVLYRGYG